MSKIFTKENMKTKITDKYISSGGVTWVGDKWKPFIIVVSKQSEEET